MLPLDLYINLSSDMSINCGEADSPQYTPCISQVARFMMSTTMRNKLRESFDLYDHMDKMTFTSMLFDEVGCNCTYGQPMFDFYGLAAQKLGPDNYVVNYGLGNLYYHVYTYEPALSYFMASLKNAKASAFPSTAERKRILSLIEDNIANALRLARRPSDALAYADESIALNHYSPLAFEHRCEIRKALDQFDAALKDCNSSIALRDYSYVRLVRGQVYKSMNRDADAVVDFKAALAMHDEQSDTIHSTLLTSLAGSN
jgi:tetratricopeptide (TPR) repeat protein